MCSRAERLRNCKIDLFPRSMFSAVRTTRSHIHGSCSPITQNGFSVRNGIARRNSVMSTATIDSFSEKYRSMAKARCLFDRVISTTNGRTDGDFQSKGVIEAYPHSSYVSPPFATPCRDTSLPPPPVYKKIWRSC